MDDLELTRAIAQVRRSMPRNALVMAICDALEHRMRPPVTLERIMPLIKTRLQSAMGGFDRKAYMRDYMKKRRAQKKPNAQDR